MFIKNCDDKVILNAMVDNIASNYDFVNMVRVVNSKNERIYSDCTKIMHHLQQSHRTLKELLSFYKR